MDVKALRLQTTFLIGSGLGLAVGSALQIADYSTAGNAVWAATTTVAIGVAIGSVWEAFRSRRIGVDIIAILALIGTLLVQEFLAGAVIALMLASGGVLEARASARARRDLQELLSRAPRVVHRYEGEKLSNPSIDDVKVGDLLLVQSGEVVPADGRVDSGVAVVDESMLTGEALPVERGVSDPVRSGSVNAGTPFALRVTAPPSQSAYEGIVRLVRDAQASSAPFVRMADRFAIAFVPLTLVVAGLAWIVSGELVRAVAVLVVATPCPLILAAPIAITSGLARTAKRGVVVKGGAALEQLAAGEVLLFDKTGTLTEGHPSVSSIVSADVDENELLRLAASLDQVSPHVLASAIVHEALSRDLVLTLPDSPQEIAGRGIVGNVDGHKVRIGKWQWVADQQREPVWTRSVRRRAALEGSLVVFVSIDGHPSGAIVLDDRIRSDASRMISDLRVAGIRRVIMVTGDRTEVADPIGSRLNIDEVFAERSPEGKVDVVRTASTLGKTVMVGDGINDAPALATASVGVAMGTRGASASSEVADVVLTVENLDRLAEAMMIGRRAHRIALQSVTVGMGLSLCAMVFAAWGLLAPTAGAILQEAIDVVVILNALRALRGGNLARRSLVGADAQVGQRFASQHEALRPSLGRIRDAAAGLTGTPIAENIADVRAVHAFLVDEVLAHEDAEHAELYPILSRASGASSISSANRTYIEIRDLVRHLGRLLQDVDDEAIEQEDVKELQRILYGINAVLRLHFADEEEQYFSLIEASPNVARKETLKQ